MSTSSAGNGVAHPRSSVNCALNMTSEGEQGYTPWYPLGECVRGQAKFQRDFIMYGTPDLTNLLMHT